MLACSVGMDRAKAAWKHWRCIGNTGWLLHVPRWGIRTDLGAADSILLCRCTEG